MWFASAEVLGSYVDDVASDRLGRVQGQREVLVNLEDAQLAEDRGFVDGPFVYRVGLRLVDKLAGNRTGFF